MALNTRTQDNSLIIDLAGRLDVHLASEIEDEINNLIKTDDSSTVILNLENVEYMSSSGLRVFVSLMRTLHEVSRNLKLSNLSQAVQKVFEVVELMDMFDIYESVEEAIASR